MMLETTDRSMTSALSMLRPIATMNSNPNHQVLFCDPKKGAAIAGFRREVANFGVCLVKAQYGPGVEMKVGERYEEWPGMVNYRNINEYIDNDEAIAGIPGEVLGNGEVELNDFEEVSRKIERVRLRVEDKHAVGLRPALIYKFMESNYRSYGSTFENRKFNMQFTSGTYTTVSYTHLTLPTMAVV